MAATTSQGTGPGSVSNIKPLIKNGSVLSGNLAPQAVFTANNNDTRVINVIDATVTLTEAAHAGRVVVLNRAAGVTVTLPASNGHGDVYTIVVGTTVSSNSDIVKVANISDSFVGRAIACADGGSTVNGWEVVSGDDTITLNGGTKGGYAGDTIQIIDIGNNLFVVNAFLNQTASEATPFSATVS